MIKRKLIYWLIQFSAWGFIVGIIGIANFLQNGYSLNTVIQLVEIFILFILSSHFIREIYIRKDWFSFKVPKLILNTLLLIFALSTGWIIFFTIINSFIFIDEQSLWTHLRNGTFLLNIILYSIFLILWTAVYIANHLFRKSHIQELNNLKLQTNQSQYELKTLRDQLNPHFLFNSLNNIRALIEIDPEHAKVAITTLSSLLRSSLLLGKRTYIPLQDEIKLVSEYLKLEKIRYDERLDYEITNNLKDISSVFIPPFIIQGMVENAIKHGISVSSSPGKIDIRIQFDDDNLLLEVENDGKYSNSNNEGIGIINTKRRLKILYKNNAGFDIRNKNDRVRATIWINKKYLNQLTA